AAVELTQDVFARIWEYMAGGQTIEHFRAFAFRVARNAIADYVKKSRPVYEHELGDKAEAILDVAVPGDAETKAELAGLLSCMRRLDEDDQEIVTLRYTEGIPVKDIAAERNEKPNTITQRLKRALKALQECLGVVPAPQR
ncbi:MAG: sigma-70 family RNA polymerase sigma factor, partial [Patescibacteria group bacterium]